VPVSLADWWLEFSEADQAGREDLAKLAREELRQQPKAVKVTKLPRNATAKIDTDSVSDVLDREESTDGELSGNAPKKRRRRRRKPDAGAVEI
jgi:poly(A) polymerase